MSDQTDSSVNCPYCGAEITHLFFKMIETKEDRFTEKKIDEMHLEIEELHSELEHGHGLSSAQKILHKNRIEYLEMQLKNPISIYKERVYCCPECNKILTIVPANDIKQLMDLMTSAAYDIRNLS